MGQNEHLRVVPGLLMSLLPPASIFLFGPSPGQVPSVYSKAPSLALKLLCMLEATQPAGGGFWEGFGGGRATKKGGFSLKHGVRKLAVNTKEWDKAMKDILIGVALIVGSLCCMLSCS